MREWTGPRDAKVGETYERKRDDGTLAGWTVTEIKTTEDGGVVIAGRFEA